MLYNFLNEHCSSGCPLQSLSTTYRRSCQNGSRAERHDIFFLLLLSDFPIPSLLYCTLYIPTICLPCISLSSLFPCVIIFSVFPLFLFFNLQSFHSHHFSLSLRHVFLFHFSRLSSTLFSSSFPLLLPSPSIKVFLLLRFPFSLLLSNIAVHTFFLFIPLSFILTSFPFFFLSLIFIPSSPPPHTFTSSLVPLLFLYPFLISLNSFILFPPPSLLIYLSPYTFTSFFLSLSPSLFLSFFSLLHPLLLSYLHSPYLLLSHLPHRSPSFLLSHLFPFILLLPSSALPRSSIHHPSPLSTFLPTLLLSILFSSNNSSLPSFHFSLIFHFLFHFPSSFPCPQIPSSFILNLPFILHPNHFPTSSLPTFPIFPLSPLSSSLFYLSFLSPPIPSYLFPCPPYLLHPSPSFLPSFPHFPSHSACARPSS